MSLPNERWQRADRESEMTFALLKIDAQRNRSRDSTDNDACSDFHRVWLLQPSE
jgi:hypothetical protein